LEVDEAQAGFDGADAKEIRDQNTLAQHSQQLWRLTGLDAAQAQVAGDVIAAPMDDISLEEWQQRAQAGSPALRAAEQTLALAKIDVTEKRGLHLPVVALSATYNDSRNPASFPLRQRGSTLGINLTLPIYAGGGPSSQLREAIARQQAAQDRLLGAKRQLSEEINKAWRNLRSGAALLRAQQRLLQSSQNKLDSTRLGAKVGIRTHLDLLQAEQAYYDALSGVVGAKHGYLSAQVQLAQLAGVLDEVELVRINRVIQR
ncbi:TolC family protein, partial [Chitinimonas sp. PSY-7]|uniref:TolC family protein n=2 Tax=Chitinimonas sp. PSY-7 TaxID=3459088 RepID=UPI004040106A